MTNGLGENKMLSAHEIIDKILIPTNSIDKIIDLMKKCRCHPINLARIKEGDRRIAYLALGTGRLEKSYENMFSGGIISQ